MSSLLLDNTNNDSTADDPLRILNNNTKVDDTAPVVWDSDTTTNPFTFWKVLRSNIMDCCIPKQKKRNETSRGEFHDDTSETYHETLPFEAYTGTTTEELSYNDTNRMIPEGTPTAAASTSSTAMTKHWMSPNTYTIEVWNAIVTVLCLNVFVQFFTGKKK